MSDERRDLVGEFRERYQIIEHPALRRAERRVIGADYGATSYTTAAQAALIADLLELTPGRTLLDVGAGAGWPAVYMGHITGCRVVVTDVPVGGLEIAARRAESDGVEAAAAAASGEALPFRDRSFDAVSSSDVLC